MKLSIILLALLSFAVNSAEIGRVKTSGLLMKDSIVIDSFTDPTIDGVACHVTSPKRAMSFEDPTNTSIACRQVKRSVTGNFKATAKNVFGKSKGIFFKSMTVDRFYDAENNTLVYLAYTKKLFGHNASHSLSSVPLYLNNQ